MRWWTAPPPNPRKSLSTTCQMLLQNVCAHHVMRGFDADSASLNVTSLENNRHELNTTLCVTAQKTGEQQCTVLFLRMLCGQKRAKSGSPAFPKHRAGRRRVGSGNWGHLQCSTENGTLWRRERERACFLKEDNTWCQKLLFSCPCAKVTCWKVGMAAKSTPKTGLRCSATKNCSVKHRL